MAFQRRDELPFDALFEGYERLFDGDSSAVPFDFEDQLTVGRSVFRSVRLVESELRERGVGLRADARFGLATITIAWAVDPRLARGDSDLDDLTTDVVDAMRFVLDRTQVEDGVITLHAVTSAVAQNWASLKDKIWR
jgi:hypothetical protein